MSGVRVLVGTRKGAYSIPGSIPGTRTDYSPPSPAARFLPHLSSVLSVLQLPTSFFRADPSPSF